MDENETFSVCLENELSNDVNCKSAKLFDEDKAVLHGYQGALNLNPTFISEFHFIQIK